MHKFKHMKIIIEIKEGAAKLVLKDNEKIVDEFVFSTDHSISEKLLPAIDDILSKNGLKPEDIEKMEAATDLGESYTSRRIVEAVANAFNWTKK